MKRIALKDLRKVTLASIQRAGARYTPTIHPDAPNLPIRPLVNAIDALAHSSAYARRLDEIEKELRKAWRDASAEIRRLFNRKIAAADLCATFVKQLREEKPGSSNKTVNRLRRTLEVMQSRIRPYEDALYTENAQVDAKASEARNNIAARIHSLQTFQAPLRKLSEFIRSPDFALITNNRLFLQGGWGTGKTHLLCDIAKARSDQSLPTMLLLAQTFPRGIDPLMAVCQVSRLARTPHELLVAFDRLGQRSGTRALLIIDGINEGDRVAWRYYMRSVINRMRRFRNVGLILSCRTPFNEQILTTATQRAFVQTRHTGFVDIEFDAQKEFFRHYEIPTPHIPLLAPEFSRPLFLKILCESIASLSRGGKHKRINDFATGHKGMAKLLEDFVVRIGKKIEDDFALPHKTCWRLLKGQGEGPSAAGIAVLMAEQGRDYISRTDCLAIIAHVARIVRQDTVEAFLARLTTEGLLTEDAVYEGGIWLEVIRLPYQRFSDHLISRHLLSRHLKTASEIAIRRSFFANRPLGRIFKPDQRRRNFAMPGLASALMLEFPERVKRAFEDRRELIFYLPRASRTGALIEPFIEGLLWRSIDSFGNQTGRIVSNLLNSRDRHIQRELLEALVCLASRTGHPYSAHRLYKYLVSKGLVERDLFWSEFLRSREATSAVYRTQDWIQTSEAVTDEATAANLIYLCALFLTTTVRTLRDRSTHCLVLIGERHPKALFGATAESLAFNDPYVAERMLAACYGVLMRKWAFPPSGLANGATILAGDLRRRLLGSRNVAPMEHILMRDYAEGIIELAAKLSPGDAPRLHFDGHRISRKSIIPAGSRISNASVKDASAGIRMDFDNYTTGRLVEGRDNYDFEHTEFRLVQRQIRWRMVDLGYDSSLFDRVDREIEQSNFYMRRDDGGEKVDRYGKKYSLIAFFEVAGRRRILGTLPHRDDIRISDTDIDPSFPAAPLEWSPPVKMLFNVPQRSPASWMGRGPNPDYRDLLVRAQVDNIDGPWVLLQGYVNERASKGPRQAFTFLRGLFVTPADVQRLATILADKAYPGNRQIPDPGADYYLFAGEIGWSRKFAGSLRDATGRARPQMDEAFAATQHRVIEKRYGSLTPSEKAGVDRPSLAAFLHGVSDPEDVSGLANKPNKMVKLHQWINIPGVPVELPTWGFTWESYHSHENTGGHPDYPAPALVEMLGLRKNGAVVDLVTPDGKFGMQYRQFGSEPAFRSRVLYLRRNLLERYLKSVGRVLVWINWGERSLHHEVVESVRENRGMRAIWDAHSHVHKQFAIYDDGRAVVQATPSNVMLSTGCV